MKKVIILILVSMAFSTGSPSLVFKGTATGYGSLSHNYSSGAQFIPILEGSFLPDTSTFIADFEFSADTYARYDTMNAFSTGMKPYRAWMRFAGNQFEFRVGLQKITFGKAQLLRGLSWFDTLDPRDPLGLTQGVWAERFRYYIPNSNANIWLWAIQEELSSTSFYIPLMIDQHRLIGQYGGRMEVPVFQGEIGLSYNYKLAGLDTTGIEEVGVFTGLNIHRHQFALDGKWDNFMGLWFELVFTHERSDFTFLSPNAYMLTEIAQLTLGFDYTFDIGNGLLIIGEYMGNVIHSDMDLGLGSVPLVVFKNVAGCMLSYPLGLFDSFGFMSLMDLDNPALYAYVFWQRQYDNLSLRLSGALTNVDQDAIFFPGQTASASLGNMIQLMLIYDFKIRVGGRS
jgi:hypothetical protein